MLTHDKKKVRLEKGDTIALQKRTGRLMVFRPTSRLDHRLFWNTGDNKSHLMIKRETFFEVAEMIADTAGLTIEKVTPDNPDEYVTVRLI